MRTEFTDLDAVRAADDLRDAVVVGLDLGAEELRVPMDGALFLGCALSPGAQRRAAAAGALVFPAIPDLPYDVYRSRLYTPAELFAGFDPADPAIAARRLGLTSMRERAAALGGTLTVDSAPGQGTTVTLEVAGA